MKKLLLSVLLAFALIFTGCSVAEITDAEGDDGLKEEIEDYKKEAQDCIDNGDIEGAIEILEEAIDETESDELEDMLDMIKAVAESSKSEEAESDAEDEKDTEKASEDTNNEAEQEAAEEAVEEPAKEPVEETEKAPAEESAEKPVEKPAEEPQAQQTNLLNGMSAKQIKELTLFLSNFSEAKVSGFDKNNIDAEALLSFAFNHNELNTKKVSYANGNDIMKASDVDATLYRYFNLTVPHESVGMYTYDGTNFYIPSADGAPCAYFSIPTGFYSNSDGTYTLTFHVFYDHNNPHNLNSAWYDYTLSQAHASCTHYQTGTALVMGTQSGYILEKYTVTFVEGNSTPASAPASSYTPESNAASATPMEEIDSILSGTLNIVDYDTGSETIIYELPSVNDAYLYGCSPARYAVSDITGDGIPELFVEYSNAGDTAVIHKYNGKWYANYAPYRGLIGLTVNGTCSFSYSAFHGGIQKISFVGAQMVQNVIAEANSEDEANPVYYVNGAMVTEEQYYQTVESEFSAEELTWERHILF